MKNIKEIIKNIKHKNAATVVGASIARPPSKARPHIKTILTILPIIILLIAVLITITITNAAKSTTEPETSQTFTEDGDGYYIWVRAVDHAGNKSEWSEAQRIWIDTKGPTAPTITGGSSEYALSRTISVKTAADDSGASGVAYYEYYQKSGADKPADTVTGTKVTTSSTSQKFDTNIAGDYVFFRAVDVVGNKGAWSDGQQVCVDINSPTVKANNSSVTITKGDNVAMSTYFTTSANGNAAISSTTYKIGSTSYTYTDGLAVGTYTVTCTVTKVTGKSESATMTLVVKSALPASSTVNLYVGDSWVVPEGCTMVYFQLAYGSYAFNITSSTGRECVLSGNKTKYGYFAYVPVTAGSTLTIYNDYYAEGKKLTLTYGTDINGKSQTSSDHNLR